MLSHHRGYKSQTDTAPIAITVEMRIKAKRLRAHFDSGVHSYLFIKAVEV